MKHFALLAVLLLSTTHAAAQDVTVLQPLLPTYDLNGFKYQPPKGDGWRDVGSAPESVRLVYAEQIGEGQINSRMDFHAQAFLVPEPDKAPDAAQLTKLSMAQRIEEKKEDKALTLVAMSRIEPVEAEIPTFEYTLVLKVGEEEFFENYVVALAPDKTQYLAAKLVTKDKDFREQPYYAPLRASITGLTFSASDKPKTQEPPPAQAPPADTTTK